MKYYRNQTGDVYAYEDDGTQDHLIEETLVAMSDADVEAHINPPPVVASSGDVKAEAKLQIESMFPDHVQRNYIARQSELDRIESGTMRDDEGNLLPARPLTAAEVAELIHIKSAWDWILSVRTASNLIENDPPLAPNLKTDNRWPEYPVT